MKRYAILALMAIYVTGCNSYKDDTVQSDENKDITLDTNPPIKGNWKVNKETDEYGNVIKYDSIYSYASSDGNLQEVVEYFQSIHTDRFEAFEDKFFDEKMLEQFPNLEQIMQRMEVIQKQMTRNYKLPMLIAPEKEKDSNEKE